MHLLHGTAGLQSLYFLIACDLEHSTNGTCLNASRKAFHVSRTGSNQCPSPRGLSFSSSAGPPGDLHPTGVWVVLSDLAMRAFGLGHPRAELPFLGVLTHRLGSLCVCMFCFPSSPPHRCLSDSQVLAWLFVVGCVMAQMLLSQQKQKSQRLPPPRLCCALLAGSWRAQCSVQHVSSHRLSLPREI